MPLLSSRRGFLKTAVLLPVAAGIGSGAAFAAVGPPKRVGGPKLRISINAYSFAKLLNDQLLGRGAGMSLIELAEFCAKHDFDAIDPTAYFLPGYRERSG